MVGVKNDIVFEIYYDLLNNEKENQENIKQDKLSLFLKKSVNFEKQNYWQVEDKNFLYPNQLAFEKMEDYASHSTE
jgi:hypothetical protein